MPSSWERGQRADVGDAQGIAAHAAAAQAAAEEEARQRELELEEGQERGREY
jgi:hypothetical protein